MAILSVENSILLGAVLLGIIQLLMAAQLATRERGIQWNVSSRNEVMPPLTGVAGRAERAFANYKETFPFFLAAVFLVMFTGRGGPLSAIGAYMYLIARVVYVPMYLLEVIVVRSFVWLISMIGIVLILVQALVGG